MLGQETEPQDTRDEARVRGLRPALAAGGHKTVHRHPQRHAGAAAVAMRAVGEHAAASKAVRDESGIGVGMDQVAGGGDLRTRLPDLLTKKGVAKVTVG